MAAVKAKRMTKSQIIGQLAEDTELTRKQVNFLFESLQQLIKKELTRRGGPGEFVIPELALKLKVRRSPARKGVKIRNPQTGEITIRDIPASKKLRATPLKKLKELVL